MDLQRIAIIKLSEFTGEFMKLATSFTKKQNLNEDSVMCHSKKTWLERWKYNELY